MLGGGGTLKNKVNETTGNKLTNDSLAIYIDDEKVNEIPTKESGYYFDREKSSCTNDAQVEWDSINWSPAISVKEENKERISCNLYFTTNYQEGILNGTDPVLKDEMIPITIENDGTVRKADLTKPWYSYENKKWANAVIIKNSYDMLNESGKVNSATKQDGYVSFDGVDDYIDLGLTNYNFGNQVTMALKFKLKNKKNSSQEIFANVEAAGISFWTKNDNLAFELYNENESKYVNVYYQGINLNETYTVVGKYDGKKVSFYVNGILVSQSAGEFNIKSSTVPFLLGANPQLDGKNVYFSNIDVYQAALYNRALSDDEIKNNMTDGIKVTDSTKLLRYVNFADKQNYEENEIIPEDVIESYFVWIPKYRYKLWDLGNYDSLTSIDTSKVHSIDILFGDYNTDDSMGKECTTPMTSGATGNCKVGDYMTHPAFISIPSTGFWVGKFATSYKGSNNFTSLNTYDSSKIIVKPNFYVWRLNLSNAHLNGYNYKRNLDSHAMKNTEWGAVAYLSHSLYGKNGSIRLNNNSNYKTGYVANNEPTCGYTGQNDTCNIYCNDDTCNSAYNTEIGYLGSTTGNIYGIYDMSGISTEVMSMTESTNGVLYAGINQTYQSGFNGVLSYDLTTIITNGIDYPDAKYYDVYKYSSTVNNFKNRILGDATGEMGPFENKSYSSDFMMPVTSWYLTLMGQSFYYGYPFYARGYYYNGGVFSGIFSQQGNFGTMGSFRMILTPTKGNAS